MPASTGRTYAIHPALGIARLGNAQADPGDPDSWYLGAEAPYQVPNAGATYKAGGKIKKQAQRFRIYEYQDGVATREITLQQADVVGIEWSVHLANRKAALAVDQPPGSSSRPAAIPPEPFMVAGAPTPASPYWPAETRNATVTAPADRTRLCIDAGVQSVGGSVTSRALAGSVSFPGATAPTMKSVELGTLRVEPDTGRLLVFAADGISEGLANGGFSPHPTLKDWGNNDGWYDDTADGPVTATITFRDGTSARLDAPATRGWVIAAAPRYTPAFNQFTSLYHVAQAITAGSGVPVPRPSFARDIFPILRSSSDLSWVSARGSLGHGPTRGGYFLAGDVMQLLASNDTDPSSQAYKARQAILARIRNPNTPPPLADIQKSMPQVSHDITTNQDRSYEIGTVTTRQYAMLQQWAAGTFDADGQPAVVALESLPVAQQPDALDRAALEGTAGTPFYPGIESWRILKAPAVYAGMLRFAGDTQPGDLTIGNALPWQADFLDCNDIWWPIQRPNEVTRAGKALQPWVPTAWIPTEDKADYNAMVAGWWQLGFVVTQDNGASYVEVEGTAGGTSA